MGFFSIFKTPVDETLGIICKPYKNKLNSTGDSKLAFIELANEALNQATKHNQYFESVTDTYKFLSPLKFEELSKSHAENKQSIECYLFNMMMYIRKDYYKPPDYSKNKRLKVLIDTNLNY